MGLLYLPYIIIVLILMPVLTPKGNTTYKLIYLLLSLGLPVVGLLAWCLMRR